MVVWMKSECIEHVDNSKKDCLYWKFLIAIIGTKMIVVLIHTQIKQYKSNQIELKHNAFLLAQTLQL